MKKTSKALALVAAVCLLVSLMAGCTVDINIEGMDLPAAETAAAAESFAQLDATHWGGGSVTITGVETDPSVDGYVDGTLFGYVSKVLYDGGEIEVDAATQYAILTVDGVQYDLFNISEPVTYTGDVVITLADKGDFANSGNAKFGDDAGSLIGNFYYTGAVYVDADGYEEASSVVAAQGGAQVDNEGASGLVFDSEGDYFGAVYINGADYTISDSVFTAFGKGGDDFTGSGSAVVVTGESNVTIDNCVFTTGGALRSAIWAGGRNGAQVDVTNTVIQSYNEEDFVPYNTEDNYATPMMQQVPFALGLTGNIRATLDCGNATITFTDSLVASNGWAVLSTDSGSGTLIATDMIAVVGEIEEAQDGADYDLTYAVSGTEYGIELGHVGDMSGYIAYCDGFTDYAYGCEWYAPDYLAIITGGSVTVGASDNNRFYGYSERTAFMSHKTSTSTLLEVTESDFDVKDNFAIVKSAGGNGETINLADSTINIYGTDAWSGSLLEVITSDDLGGGPGATTFVIPYSDYETYLSNTCTGAKGETIFNVTNCNLVGNVYDSNGSMNGTSFSDDSIRVNLVDSSIEGVISSSYAVHCDADGTAIIGDMTVDSYTREGTYDYLVIGRNLNFAAPAVCNSVSLDMTGSAWICTGLSYLASLTVDDDSVIDGDVYQDGQKLELKAGTYENVIVVPAGTDLETAVNAGVEAIETALANGVVPADCSDLVANTDTGSSGEAS